MNTKAMQAKAYSKEGYNCCMAVIKPFIAEMDVDEDVVMKVASSLGGGLGYLREICGAVSGMAVVLGLKYGYVKGFDGDADKKAKAEHYALVKQIGLDFKVEKGALTCRDLLHLDENDQPLPGYQDFIKPCPDLVAYAAQLVDEYIKKIEAQ